MGRSVRSLLALTLALSCGAFAAPSAHACADADLPFSPAVRAQVEAAVLCLTNVERAAKSLPALKADKRLTAAAFGHSSDMAQQNYFSHTSLDGRTLGERVSATGYAWRSVGENIAAGYRTARSVMLGWMTSKGHCVNILREAWTGLGVGVAAGGGSYGVWWTQNFGRVAGGGGADSSATASCPHSKLAPAVSGGSDRKVGCIAAGCRRLKLQPLQRRKGMKLRVRGSISGPASCRRVSFAVKRGKRTLTTRKKLCKSRFVVTLKIPRVRGSVRGSARVSVRAGAGLNAVRKLRL